MILLLMILTLTSCTKLINLNEDEVIMRCDEIICSTTERESYEPYNYDKAEKQIKMCRDNCK